MYQTEVHVLNIHVNVQNILLKFHNLVCNRTVQLALGTALMLEYISDNIGLVLACPNTAASPSQYVTQPSRIPILSPVLFMHVGDPYIPPF